VQNFKGKLVGAVYEQRGNIFQENAITMKKEVTRSGGFKKFMSLEDYDRKREGKEPKRTYFEE
ncbi:unnamed protein product, partial [Aphanomyces euteiches]